MSESWKKVLATHEEAQKLVKDRPWPGDEFPGVALPSSLADSRWIVLRYGSLWTCAQAYDLGPFCHDDDAYVFGTARPRAEIYKGKRCPVTLTNPDLRPSVPDGHGGMRKIEFSNGAGIDLFPRTARQLGIKIGDNVQVEWRFLNL